MNDREPSQPAPPAREPPSAPPRQRRKRRWLRRLIIAILLVIVLAIGGAQVILWSDFPRGVVVQQLERQLGLRITARSLSTGWFGHTTLRDVTATLPLSDDHFLFMPHMDVRHTSLVRMIFGRPLQIDRIEVQRPTLIIQQYASGRWNMLEAVDVVTRATHRPGAAPGTRMTSASIPELHIRNAIVRIVDNRRNEARIEPLTITGQRDGPILYRVGAAVPQRLDLEGQIVPGTVWQHEFDVALTQPDDWLRPFIAQLPQDTFINANWRGQVRDGEILGRAYFDPIRADAQSASGFVMASSDRGTFTFRPQRLVVQTGTALAPELLIASGAVMLDAQSVRADEMRISGAGGNAQLSGAYDWTTRDGKLHAVWSDMILRQGVTQDGSIRAALTTAFPNEPRITAAIASRGSIDGGAGDWDAQLEITGSGESFSDINWQGRFNRLLYDWRRDVDLSGLTLTARQRDGTLLILDDLSLPERGRISGRGEIDFADQDWWLAINGRDVGLQRTRRHVALAFDVDLAGTFNFIDVRRMYLSAEDLEFSASGFYDADRPQPIELRALLTHTPEIGDEKSPILRGWLRAEADVVGTLLPLKLDLAGELRGRALQFRGYNLGDPRGALTGTITADSAAIQTHHFRLLDAEWDIEGDWPVDPARSFELTIEVNALPLDRLGDVFGDDQLSGTAGMRMRMLIPEPRLDALIVDDARFTARGLSVAPFHAQHVSGSLTLRDGILRVDPIELRELDGTATASARADLRSPDEWLVQLRAEHWPLEVQRAGSVLGSMQADVRLNLETRAVWGNVHFDGALTREGSPVGSVVADVTADGRAIRLMRLDGQVLRGTFSGAGSYLLDDPNRTQLLLEFAGVNAGMLATWVPELDEFSGVFHGRLDVQPSDDPRALGPLAINLSLAAPDGGWRAIALTGIQLTANANLRGDERQFLLVTRDAQIELAEGDARAFARLSRRRDDGTLAVLIDVDYSNLSLDQLVQAMDPGADPMPGRLTGNLSLAGDPRSPRGIFGDVNLTLSESDLANFDPIAVLYDLMRVGATPEGPTGRGHLSARLDNQSLQVTQFFLFNRGVEVRGVAAIENVFQAPDTPIAGTLIGTARPLAALRLPFMADVDQVFSALQAHATTVEITGTLRDPDARPTTLDDVGDALRALLVGEVQRERRLGPTGAP